MTRRLTEIVVQFKCAPFYLFRNLRVDRLAPNARHPGSNSDEVFLCISAPRFRGPTVRIGTVDMGFSVCRLFRECSAYRVRNAAPRCHGRRRDAVSARRQHQVGWSVVQMILDVWSLFPGRRPFRTIKAEAGALRKPTHSCGARGRGEVERRGRPRGRAGIEREVGDDAGGMEIATLAGGCFGVWKRSMTRSKACTRLNPDISAVKWMSRPMSRCAVVEPVMRRAVRITCRSFGGELSRSAQRICCHS